MFRLARAFLVAASVLVVGTPAGGQSAASASIHAASPEVYETVRSIYDYNQKAAARLDTVFSRALPGYAQQKLVLTVSPHAPVPAYVAIPKSGKAPFPLVLLIHGFSSSKDEWFHDGITIVDSLTSRGFAVLALDAPFHGERGAEGAYRLPGATEDLRDAIVQGTVEYRRMLDALGSRGDIDVSRVAVVGYSMGTLAAFALAAIDPRVKVAVAAVSPVGVAKEQTVVAVAPQTFAGALRVPILMLMGRKDPYYTVSEAQQLFAAIHEPRKDLAFYDSGHGLPPAWISRATAWVVQYLK